MAFIAANRVFTNCLLVTVDRARLHTLVDICITNTQTHTGTQTPRPLDIHYSTLIGSHTLDGVVTDCLLVIVDRARLHTFVHVYITDTQTHTDAQT